MSLGTIVMNVVDHHCLHFLMAETIAITAVVVIIILASDSPTKLYDFIDNDDALKERDYVT